MHRINKQLHTACGCLVLGCANAVFAASGIPTLNEVSAGASAGQHVDLMRQIAHGLVREPGDEHRFRHFADLFLVAEEHQPAGGLGANITAAIFGQGETKPGGPVFGGGGSSMPKTMAGNGNMIGSESSVANNGPVNASIPGGSGGASGGGGGGGGMGGGGFVDGDPDSEFDAASADSQNAGGAGNSGNENGNGNIVSFADNAPNGNGHHGSCCCCCCCPGNGFNSSFPVNVEVSDSNGGSDTADAGMTAAIPLPAPLWIGLIGLAAVGWMRQRRLVT